MDENEITYKIRGAVFRVYNNLGPGLLESVYEAAMVYELRKHGLKVTRQQEIDVIYEGHSLGLGFRMDLVVNDKVVIELKSVEELAAVHHKQLLTYLRLTKCTVGILVNFNTDDISNSIVRKVNGYKETR
jgi:GxxExxY protein